MKRILYTVAFLMIAITALGFSTDFGEMSLASGSDILMSYASTDIFLRLFFLVAFVMSVIFLKKFGNKILATLTLIILFALWFLSGRMIAIFPDGRLVGGWFYFPTETTELCKSSKDCEITLHYETSYTRESFWFYRVKNKEVEIVKFAGPFIANDVDNLLARKLQN